MKKIDHAPAQVRVEKRNEMSQMYAQARDLRLSLEKKMSEKEMPAVVAHKSELGETWVGFRIDSELEISIQPKKDETDDPWLEDEIVWDVTKGRSGKEATKPTVLVDEIDNQTLKQMKELPRHYRGLDDGETGYVFKDEANDLVGWVAVRDYPNTRTTSLSFIGVKPDMEGIGFGSAILDWLKERNEAISLKPLAYDTAQRGLDIAISRLKQFYVANGFVYTDSGMFAWQRQRPNLEDVAAGETLLVKEELVADGTLYSKNDIMRIYLNRLSESGKLGEILSDDGTRDAKLWLELRQKAIEIEKELERAVISR